MAQTADDIKYDKILNKILDKYKSRSIVGQNKYGTTLDRKDLSIIDWINHAQEEAMDFTLYLEKIRELLLTEGINID